MKARDLIKHVKHRPFPIPNSAWKYYQEWNKALFLHWEVSPNTIQEILPKDLKVDLINGKTWISLVAFDMNNIGVRYLPKVPHISDFHEINIRVYVTYNEKPAVYFLSMEGSKRSSCSILKGFSKFPYRFSKMKRSSFSYDSKNANFNDYFSAEYRLENTQIIKDETDIWLTERYTVFQDHKEKLIEYDVHHIEWPMQNIDVKSLNLNYPRFKNLIDINPDRMHYSSGVQVLTWEKNIIV